MKVTTDTEHCIEQEQLYDLQLREDRIKLQLKTSKQLDPNDWNKLVLWVKKDPKGWAETYEQSFMNVIVIFKQNIILIEIYRWQQRN